MNGHWKLVAAVVMAVGLAIPCQVQSGHFDVLRNSSPDSGKQGLTITIQIPPGVLGDQNSGGAIQPEGMATPQKPKPVLRLPFSYGTSPSDGRALAITVKFSLYTGKSRGSLSIPAGDAWEQNIELALAISPNGGESLAGPPVNGPHGYVSHGLPGNGLARTGSVVPRGTLPCSEGQNPGQIELTVLKSYPNPDTGPGLQLLDTGPKKHQKTSMKILSDVEVGR